MMVPSPRKRQGTNVFDAGLNQKHIIMPCLPQRWEQQQLSYNDTFGQTKPVTEYSYIDKNNIVVNC